MGVLAKRLRATGPEWRLPYKALLLLEHMAKHGPQAVVDELAANSLLLDGLSRFEHVDPSTGRDLGVNVRERARRLGAWVADAAAVEAERAKARATANKYGGVASSSSSSSSSSAAASSSGFEAPAGSRTLSMARGGGGSGNFGGGGGGSLSSRGQWSR